MPFTTRSSSGGSTSGPASYQQGIEASPKNQNRTGEMWNTCTPPSTLSFVGPSFIAAGQPHPGQAVREAAKYSPQSGQVI
jgi:hypothetical protein